MGPDAANFGPIADMDRLDSLMDGLFKLIDRHGGELATLSKSAEEVDAENRELMARMKNQKNQLTAGMSKSNFVFSIFCFEFLTIISSSMKISKVFTRLFLFES
jgi:hypothetical protein